jgi:hypothetical protein
MRGGSGGTLVRAPESQEEAHESQKVLIILARHFILIFPFFSPDFQLKSSILREV